MGKAKGVGIDSPRVGRVPRQGAPSHTSWVADSNELNGPTRPPNFGKPPTWRRKRGGATRSQPMSRVSSHLEVSVHAIKLTLGRSQPGVSGRFQLPCTQLPLDTPLLPCRCFIPGFDRREAERPQRCHQFGRLFARWLFDCVWIGGQDDHSLG